MDHTKKLKILSLFGLLTVAIIWGSTFTANKIALTEYTPLGLMSIRFVIAFALMFLIFKKRFEGTQFKDYLGGIYCGFALFVAFVLVTYGLLFTDAGKQAFLSGAYVIAVPFITWIAFKKSPNLKTYIGAGICFLGIALLSLNQNFSINFGDTLTLLSSAMFGVHIVVTGVYIKKDDAALLATVQFGTVAILSISTLIYLRDFSFLKIVTQGLSYSNLAVLYLGLVGTTIAYYLQILSQRHSNPTTTSVILSMETVFGSLIAIVVLGEIFTLKMIFGAVLILVAIIVSEV